MNATIDDSRNYADDFDILLEPATFLDDASPETKAQAATILHEPHLDVSLAGAGVAILLWMALFTGFLYSWFTMGG